VAKADRSVLAIVLTHDAPQALARCLSAISDQVRQPEAVLVVDNASSPPAALPALSLPMRLLRSDQNGGPAGGHLIGLQAFLQSEFDLAWVMDDDCVPEVDCLRELLAALAVSGQGDVPVFPLWVDGPTGIGQFMPAWCGFLMPRPVVERIGLPRADLVWWTEDTEYLYHRVRRAGFVPIEAERAVVQHHRVRTGASKPPWKFYYEVRNTIGYRFYVQDRTRRQMRKMTRSIARLVARIIVSEPKKLVRLRAVMDGVLDGFRRRTGLRYPLESKE